MPTPAVITPTTSSDTGKSSHFSDGVSPVSSAMSTSSANAGTVAMRWVRVTDSGRITRGKRSARTRLVLDSSEREA